MIPIAALVHNKPTATLTLIKELGKSIPAIMEVALAQRWSWPRMIVQTLDQRGHALTIKRQGRASSGIWKFINILLLDRSVAWFAEGLGTITDSRTSSSDYRTCLPQHR